MSFDGMVGVGEWWVDFFILTVQFKTSGMSFMNMSNSTGPMTLPWDAIFHRFPLGGFPNYDYPLSLSNEEVNQPFLESTGDAIAL